MDPFSTLLGICVGQAINLTKDLSSSIAETFADDKVKQFTRTLKEQLKSHLALPANHDLVKGIRSAELVAARKVEKAYRKWVNSLPYYEQSDEQIGFANQLDEFIATRDGLDYRALGEDRIDHVLDEMINVVVIEGAVEGASPSRRKIELAFLEEVETFRNVKAPADFHAFFTGEDHRIKPPQGGWYDMVALYVTEQIKTNERFRSIFFATELIDIKRLITVADARIREMISQGVQSLQADIARLQAGIDRIDTRTEETARGVAETRARIEVGAEVIAKGLSEVKSLLDTRSANSKITITIQINDFRGVSDQAYLDAVMSILAIQTKGNSNDLPEGTNR